MSKATEVIEAEHREIEQLFERYPTEANMGAANKICDVLEQHTQMEEAILYPDLAQVDAELHEDAVREHAEASELIERIRGSSQPDEIAALVAELRREVAHHVEDEEGDDLPRMEQDLGEARMDELGAQMEQWKAERPR